MTWVDRDGNEEPLPAPPRAYDHPRVSPDGTRVAVDIADGDNVDVWIWNLAEERLTQLTFDQGVDDFPLWTPDSARVVFQSSREGGGVYWESRRRHGPGRATQGRRSTPHDLDSGWAVDLRPRARVSRTGTSACSRWRGERTAEMLLDTESTELDAALSSNGQWLAYTSDETGRRLPLRQAISQRR